MVLGGFLLGICQDVLEFGFAEDGLFTAIVLSEHAVVLNA